MQKKFIIINIGHGYRKIKIDDINYINIERRNLCIHTLDNKKIMGCCLRQSFREETKKLIKFQELYLIGNALIINLNNVKNIYSNYIEFINDAQIYYPPKYYKELIQNLT